MGKVGNGKATVAFPCVLCCHCQRFSDYTTLFWKFHHSGRMGDRAPGSRGWLGFYRPSMPAGRKIARRPFLTKAPGDKYSNRQLVRNGNCSQSLLYAVAAARALPLPRVWLTASSRVVGSCAACSADSSPTHRTINR
jgi:hypothetical protein